MITRRLLVVCVLFALLGTSCDPSTSSGGPDESDAVSPGAAPTPTRGGTVVVGVFGEPATLDPYAPLASDLTYALARPVYRSLYRFDSTGSPVPDLVETLEVSGELATVTLAEVSWSDGTPVTSKDVEATIARARPPSGLTAVDSVRRSGPRRLVLSGSIQDWPETLARISYVLPSSGKKVFSGPFVVGGRTAGLQIVLEPNPSTDQVPYVDRVIVQFTEGLDLLLGLLDRARIDAAWLPSSVNLAQRLDEMGLSHQQSLGWERIVLDLSGSELSIEQRRVLAATLDRRAMEQGFVRTAGRIADTLSPQPGRGGAGGPFETLFRGHGKARGVPLQLSAPSGDELLELIQRLAQVQLDSNGFDVELINVDARTFYGDWTIEDPVDAALRRLGGAPGFVTGSGMRSLAVLPLFQVESVMAWGPGVGGIQVNPTIDGPFAHAQEWFVAEGEA